MLCGVPCWWQGIWKSADGSFGRHVACRKSKSVSGVGICSSRDKLLPLPRWKCLSTFNLPPGGWLITVGRGALLGAPRWSLCWQTGHSGGWSQLSFGECQSMLLSPLVISVPATMAALFVCPLSEGRGGWGTRLTGTDKADHLTSRLLKSSLLRSLSVSVYMGCKYL